MHPAGGATANGAESALSPDALTAVTTKYQVVPFASPVFMPLVALAILVPVVRDTVDEVDQ